MSCFVGDCSTPEVNIINDLLVLVSLNFRVVCEYNFLSKCPFESRFRLQLCSYLCIEIFT